GTFKMIKTENIEEHSMDSEYFEIDADIVDEIKKVKASGKKVISVGTTTTRAIEGYMSGIYKNVQNIEYRTPNTAPPTHPSPSRGEGKGGGENLGPERNGLIHGSTNIFIYPGYKFKAVDALVTNFHLPRSTPLMLTSAFGGFEKLKEAYNTAIDHKYRFFSYGDAMLIL
ncbi:MAG: S-adenosylmethionine:tRNA ribosyltransferase-isomerase, partial [Thermodesulfovibrionales bacterium]